MKKKHKLFVGVMVVIAAVLVLNSGFFSIRSDIEGSNPHVFDLSADGSCKVAYIRWHNNFPELIRVDKYDKCELDFMPKKIHTEQDGTIKIGGNPKLEIALGGGDGLFDDDVYFESNNCNFAGSRVRSLCQISEYGSWWCKCVCPHTFRPDGTGKLKVTEKRSDKWLIDGRTITEGMFWTGQTPSVMVSHTSGLLEYNYSVQERVNLECPYATSKYYVTEPKTGYFAEEERLRAEKQKTVHTKLFECPVPDRYIYQIETFTKDFSLKDFMYRPSYFCTLEPIKIHTRTNEVKYNMTLLETLTNGGTITVTPGDKYFVTYVVSEENLRCGINEVRSCAGYCEYAMQTCIDNNLDSECDPTEPVLWMLDMNDNREIDSEDQVCSDRDGDSKCDCVIDYFCSDGDENGICDWSEYKYAATSCTDLNSNNICDEKEVEKCSDHPFSPVCGMDNITYPNECSLNEFGTSKQYDGKCLVDPIILRKDCTSNGIYCPTGYSCAPVVGGAGAACIKTDTVYEQVGCNSNSDCPNGYDCIDVGVDFKVCKMEEIVNIDCLTLGCPEGGTCIGGVCYDIKTVAGRCPDEVDCSSYDCSWTDAYGQLHESACTCNEYVGLCMQERYKLKTCDQPDIDCPSGFECVGKTCVSEDELYEYCVDSEDCNEGFECFNNKCMKIGICPEVDCPPGYLCKNHECIPMGDIDNTINRISEYWWIVVLLGVVALFVYMKKKK